MWIDIDSEKNYWLSFDIELQSLYNYITKLITLLDLIKLSNNINIISVDKDIIHVQTKHINDFKEIENEKWLPNNNSYYDCNGGI